MSSLHPGMETNAGLIYRLLCDVAPRSGVSIRYEQGVQWTRWRDTLDVIEGRGLNRQIRRAYGFIASRYRAGDRIFLFGYSRGAYGVRSLAGLIDRVGLLRAEHATVRNIRQAYRHYQRDPDRPYAIDFSRAYCHADVEIEMVGVWDTVKSLGIRLPVLWRWSRVKHAFHNHLLGDSIRHGFQALALDETRDAYAPVMWRSRSEWDGVLEQVWFRGCHADIGGHLNGYEVARPLANIPLVWMLEKAETCGIALPDGWRKQIPCDVQAPSIGSYRGWGKLFVLRRQRLVGSDVSEKLHGTVTDKEL